MKRTRRCVKKRKEYRKLVTKYSWSWQQTRGHEPTRISTSFDQIPSRRWNLVEFDRVGGTWWKTVDYGGQSRTVADSCRQLQTVYEQFHIVIYRVFHRDIPTVTGLVPLQGVSIERFLGEKLRLRGFLI